MSTTDIKEVVKEKYGQAALRVHERRQFCCGAAAGSTSCCDPITSNLYELRRPGRFPRRRCWRRWAAAIRRRWPS